MKWPWHNHRQVKAVTVQDESQKAEVDKRLELAIQRLELAKNSFGNAVKESFGDVGDKG